MSPPPSKWNLAYRVSRFSRPLPAKTCLRQSGCDNRPVQRLRFRPSHLPAVLAGAKRVTMRFQDPIEPGPALLVFESADEVVIPGRVTSTVAKRVREITDQEAREDGFPTAAAVLPRPARLLPHPGARRRDRHRPLRARRALTVESAAHLSLLVN